MATKMKLRLPNGEELQLDTSLELSERKLIVDDILDEWRNHFENSWELGKTKVCLEVLSNYLCNVKEAEDKNKEDKYVMSSTKIKKMTRFNDKNVNFTNLPKDQQQLFGLIDFEEDGNNN